MDMRGMKRVRAVIALILGMAALGLLTWGIGKVYLELVASSNHEPSQPAQSSLEDSNPDQTIVLVLPEVRFWTCQVGVYNNESNALASREQLNLSDIPAEVINSNPWVVGIGLGHSANELSQLRTSLADKGIYTIPKQIELPKRTFRVVGNGAKPTVDLLITINNLLKNEQPAHPLAEETFGWNTQEGNHPPKDLEKLLRHYNVFRAKTMPEEQKTLGLSLFCEFQRVINLLSGK